MKKSILFKSILAGALALSTFSAQANVLGFGRAFLGIATAANYTSAMNGIQQGASKYMTDKELQEHKADKPLLIACGSTLGFSSLLTNGLSYAALGSAGKHYQQLKKTPATLSSRYLLRAGKTGALGLSAAYFAAVSLTSSFMTGFSAGFCSRI